MTDKKFWNLVDHYEENGAVTKNEINDLICDIFYENNNDLDESLADLTLFNYDGISLEEVLNLAKEKHAILII